METARAIVTGGAGGIGSAICRDLAGDGSEVAAFDVDEKALALLPDPIRRVRCDAGAEDEVRDAMADLGWDSLDLLVNCSGIAAPHRGQVEALSLADWRRVTDSHLTAAFLMVRACVPLLRLRGGCIVTISSTRANMSEPNSEAYAASKGGLEGLTQALAISLGPDIRANAIAPGWIVTDPHADLRDIDNAQHPAGRAGTPQDIAAAVRYCAGAGFMTGQVVTLDGGMTRKMIYAE